MEIKYFFKQLGFHTDYHIFFFFEKKEFVYEIKNNKLRGLKYLTHSPQSLIHELLQ